VRNLFRIIRVRVPNSAHTNRLQFVLVVKFGTHLAALIKAIAVQILIIKCFPNLLERTIKLYVVYNFVVRARILFSQLIDDA